MSKQQRTNSTHDGEASWWPRFCRWLWNHSLQFLWSMIIINVVINIGSTWLITPAKTNAIPSSSIIGSIIGWVSTHWLFSILLGMISALLLLLTWQGSRWPESMPTVQISARDREHMLQRLHLRYEQMLAQSLQGATQIELGLAFRLSAIQNAASLSLRLPEQSEQALPPHTSIVDVYSQAQQELLLIGEPGAGKSTLLLELAHHLVEQAEQDRVLPLPVLLPLSSWSVKCPALQDWLIEQFALLYNIPQKLSKQWMQARLVLPLLDGLDEMDEVARPACIEAINTYHRGHLEPLVICSRTNEYDMATKCERLALHCAVIVQPLSSAQINAQLVALGKPLAGLRATMKKNATLAKLATTPLMLQNPCAYLPGKHSEKTF